MMIYRRTKMKSTLLVFFLTLCAAWAQIPTVLEDHQEEVKTTDSRFSKVALGVIDAFEQRLQWHMDHNAVSKKMFDAMFAEMIADLDMTLTESLPDNKSSADCDTACSLAKKGSKEICIAGDLATQALTSCSSSIYAIDAQYYATVACQSANFVIAYACGGPSQKAEALAWLESSRLRALQAWNNAWYSYSIDGCTANYQTAIHASNAWVHFVNAIYYMQNCS